MDIMAVDCLKVIHKEIEWCEENPEGGIRDVRHEGLIAGLKQASYLVHELTKLQYSHPYKEVQ